ncbi:MAG: heavy metal-binding domain-containing protein [Pseudomonadota bacterium]|jgi:uncharacterized protein YbjQ (UPF0145 family)|nr:heavy metal-binding domain-containing protein [Pseudomonadota bacterium]
MARCNTCGKTGFGFLEVKEGMCPSCRREAEALEASKTDAEKSEDKAERARHIEAASSLPITTETWIGDVERLGVVATEVVMGMNIFKDVLANVRDIFGGRSGAVQNTLRDARNAAFEDIKLQAAQLGADAIIAVDIDYHSISTGSSVNMMMVAVTGTAVKVKTNT